jgi:hypothetical protein
MYKTTILCLLITISNLLHTDILIIMVGDEGAGIAQSVYVIYKPFLILFIILNVYLMLAKRVHRETI